MVIKIQWINRYAYIKTEILSTHRIYIYKKYFRFIVGLYVNPKDYLL